jgi:hypothetical protein
MSNKVKVAVGIFMVIVAFFTVGFVANDKPTIEERFGDVHSSLNELKQEMVTLKSSIANVNDNVSGMREGTHERLDDLSGVTKIVADRVDGLAVVTARLDVRSKRAYKVILENQKEARERDNQLHTLVRESNNAVQHELALHSQIIKDCQRDMSTIFRTAFSHLSDKFNRMAVKMESNPKKRGFFSFNHQPDDTQVH